MLNSNKLVENWQEKQNIHFLSQNLPFILISIYFLFSDIKCQITNAIVGGVTRDRYNLIVPVFLNRYSKNWNNQNFFSKI